MPAVAKTANGTDPRGWLSGKPALDAKSLEPWAASPYLQLALVAETEGRLTEALESEGPQRLQAAVTALESKATPEEVEAYRGFVVSAARRVAEAHKEHGEQIGPAEQAALDRIGASLGGAGAQDSSS